MFEKVGRFLFRIRSYTPLPLLLLMLIYVDPSIPSVLAGGLMVGIGELIRLWAVGYAGSSTRTRSLGAARALVTTGPYAHVRNPLYLGNGLLSAGICVISGVYWIIPLFVIGYLVQYVPIVRSEENYLHQSCGDLYAAYYEQVPRWWPSFRRYSDASEHDFSWTRALKSESRTLMAIFGVCCLLALLAVLK